MKPTHAKPQLYAYYFLTLKEIARDMGYNLVVHGSMARDLDLIAIPWVNEPMPVLNLIDEISKQLTGTCPDRSEYKEYYKHTIQPGGRQAFIIDLNRGGYKRTEDGDLVEPFEFTRDPEYYIDISVTPLRDNFDRCPDCGNVLPEHKKDCPENY